MPRRKGAGFFATDRAAMRELVYELNEGVVATLYVAMCSDAEEGVLSSPNRIELARRYGYAERTFRRHLARLEQLGLVKVDRAPNQERPMVVHLLHDLEAPDTKRRDACG